MFNIFFRYVKCKIFGHKIWNPGNWERGWLHKSSWQNFNCCECRICKTIVIHTDKIRFIWSEK
jgi:hypothetical protein